MNKYEKLRNIESAKELSDSFKKEFEEALSKAIGYWQKHGMLVDKFEEDPMELSFAKGFLAGCIYTHESDVAKSCTWLSGHFYDEEYWFRDNDGTWIDADSLIIDFKKAMKGE